MTKDNSSTSNTIHATRAQETQILTLTEIEAQSALMNQLIILKVHRFFLRGMSEADQKKELRIIIFRIARPRLQGTMILSINSMEA
jgi:hypothetical protein